VSTTRLHQLADDLDQLRRRLEEGDLTTEQATELLEQVTEVAQAVMNEIERQAEALEERS
jgi:methyl-accepting chemotaxis protein